MFLSSASSPLTLVKTQTLRHGDKQRALTTPRATSENILLIRHRWEAKHTRWLMVLNSLFLGSWAWVPGLKSVVWEVIASVGVCGLWMGKPMALAEGWSCHVGCSDSHRPSGVVKRPFLEPGEELPFLQLGCILETVWGLELDIVFWILLSSYHLYDLGQLTSLLAVSQCFQM